MPPAFEPPPPLTEWQTITVTLLVPTAGRCDQHATLIDGERIGLLSATEIGRRVAAMIRKRPSVDLQAEIRRDEWASRHAFAASVAPLTAVGHNRPPAQETVAGRLTQPIEPAPAAVERPTPARCA